MTQTESTRLGDYELLERLSDSGGQGVVWKARCLTGKSDDVLAGEIVALKVLFRTGEYAENEANFKRQTENFRQIPAHPNIVRYRDSFIAPGDWDDHYCIVMDYLGGDDLKTCLQLNPNGLSWEHAKPIFEQCLLGLIHAANAGVIHRDIKPSNIFLTADGSVKIIDFGIARREDSTSTTSAGPKGAFDYMAPDFLAEDGFRGDQCSDVFSLGVCFYEALTGKLPFPSIGEGGFVGYVKRWREPKRIKPALPRNPFRVLNDRGSELVRKALGVQRADRFTSFEDMLRALNGVKRRCVQKEKRSYEFLEFLGQGGFGAVFKARSLDDDRTVAVKQLFAGHDPKRFIREARLLNETDNPHVVQYIDCIEDDVHNEYYIVMEYLEGMPGCSLRDRIRQARKQGESLHADEVRTWFTGYLHALVDFHSKGIIHRDLAPANLYAPHGAPQKAKIFDLGIARSNQTKTGGRLPGNPEYMAPELVLGNGTDPENTRGDQRSDIFSLGLCLFEAITGTSPYGRRLSKETTGLGRELVARAEGRIPICYDHPALQTVPDLAEVIKKATARRPQLRFPSAKAMLAALHKPRQMVLTGQRGGYELGTLLREDATLAIFDGHRREDKAKCTILKIAGAADDVEPSEFDRLSSISEATLVRYLDICAPDDATGNDLYIVCEHAPWLGQDVSARASRREERFAWDHVSRVFGRLLEGLHFLHARNIFVGAVLPSHVLVPEDVTSSKIACWGLHHLCRRVLAGHTEPLAPELRTDAHAEPNAQSDLYSLALCLHEALTGKRPGGSTDGRIEIDCESDVFYKCPKLMLILTRAMDMDPRRRYTTAGEMAAELASLLPPAAVPETGDDARATGTTAPTHPRETPGADPEEVEQETQQIETGKTVPVEAIDGHSDPPPSRSYAALKVAAVLAILLATTAGGVLFGWPLLKERRAIRTVNRLLQQFDPSRHAEFPRIAYMRSLERDLSGLPAWYMREESVSNLIDDVWLYAAEIPEAFRATLTGPVDRNNLEDVRGLIAEWTEFEPYTNVLRMAAGEFLETQAHFETLRALLDLEQQIARCNETDLAALVDRLQNLPPSPSDGPERARILERIWKTALDRIEAFGTKHYEMAKSRYDTAPKARETIEKGKVAEAQLAGLAALAPEDKLSSLPEKEKELARLRLRAQKAIEGWAEQMEHARSVVKRVLDVLDGSEQPADWSAAVTNLAGIEQACRDALHDWSAAVTRLGNAMQEGARRRENESVQEWEERMNRIANLLASAGGVLDVATLQRLRMTLADHRTQIAEDQQREAKRKQWEELQAIKRDAASTARMPDVAKALAAFKATAREDSALSEEIDSTEARLYASIQNHIETIRSGPVNDREQRLKEAQGWLRSASTKAAIGEQRLNRLAANLANEWETFILRVTNRAGQTVVLRAGDVEQTVPEETDSLDIALKVDEPSSIRIAAHGIQKGYEPHDVGPISLVRGGGHALTIPGLQLKSRSVTLPPDLADNPAVSIRITDRNAHQRDIANDSKLRPDSGYTLTYLRPDYVSQQRPAFDIPPGDEPVQLPPPPGPWQDDTALAKLRALEQAVARQDIDGAIRLLGNPGPPPFLHEGHRRRHAEAAKAVRSLVEKQARAKVSAAERAWFDADYSNASRSYRDAAITFQLIDDEAFSPYHTVCVFNADLCQFMHSLRRDGSGVEDAARLGHYAEKLRSFPSTLPENRKVLLQSIIARAGDVKTLHMKRLVEAELQLIGEDIIDMGAMTLPD